ncbi:hypothetical protein GCM10010302_73510 [Streptomyces polychromogenes]|uniref:Uncharacterized protein n=1 Tax=Streptomyces polychromogenes TaxID=67342 RepID=A0ABN0W2Y6_9ACTN
MSSEPIPQDIETGALARARARHLKSLEAKSDPDAVVERIAAAAIAAGLEDKPAPDGKSILSKERQYIDALVRDKAKLTPPDGTKPISAFWTFGIEHPEAPENDWGVPFLSQRFIAEEWAVQQNLVEDGTAQTLETTRGGQELDDMCLFEPEVIQALGGAEWGFPPGYAKAVWGEISKTYGGVAEGRVIVFGQTADTRSILQQQELGELCANPNVGLHNINFVYEAPQSWPEITRAEAGTNAVRAVAQFDNKDQPRYIDPHAFAADSPEARKAKVEAVLEALAPAQAQAPAVAAPEGQASPKRVPNPLWQMGFRQPGTVTRPKDPGPVLGAGSAGAAALAPTSPAKGMDGPA